MNSIITATTILHITAGAFFVTTGARKLFLPSVRNKVIPFIQRVSRVPKPAAYAVVSGEFFGGLGLLFGVLSQLAALGLLVIMAGAYLHDTWPTVRAKQAPGDHWSKLLSNAMCTPEFQLIVVLLAILFAGPQGYGLL